MTEQEWKKEFADNLKNMIRDSKLKRSEFRLLVGGVTAAELRNWLDGSKIPTVKMLLRISDVLDCYVDDLVNFGELIE